MRMDLRTPGASYELFPRQQEGGASAAVAELGPLPEWNLADLYTGPDAPEIARDLHQANGCVNVIRHRSGETGLVTLNACFHLDESWM